MTLRKASVISIVCIATSWLLLQGCVVSGHPAAPAQWGAPSSARTLEALIDQPGPVTVESVAAADWEVPREGLLNLEHPKAKAAGLAEGPEPIRIYFHALRHPTRGLFIVDTGVQRALVNDKEHAIVRGLVAELAQVDRIRVKIDTASWLASQREPLAGVFLTHLHLDHILGLPDIPRGTPIFTGPGEARASGAMNLFTRPITDRALEGHAALGEWRFEPDPAGRFAGVLDVLGDGSIWALHVPGHTPGSTAYLARTPQGPVLFAGDACHTRWGWEHGVEPGTFSSDLAQSAESLKTLEQLAQRHPQLDVRLGHQAR